MTTSALAAKVQVDHLISRTDPAGFEGKVESRSRRVHGDRVPGPHGFGELLLECTSPRTGRDPAQIENLEHGFLLETRDRRSREWQEGRPFSWKRLPT